MEKYSTQTFMVGNSPSCKAIQFFLMSAKPEFREENRGQFSFEQQSIDFNEIEEQDMTSILVKLRQQRAAILDTYGHQSKEVK